MMVFFFSLFVAVKKKNRRKWWNFSNSNKFGRFSLESLISFIFFFLSHFIHFLLLLCHVLMKYILNRYLRCSLRCFMQHHRMFILATISSRTIFTLVSSSIHYVEHFLFFVLCLTRCSLLFASYYLWQWLPFRTAKASLHSCKVTFSSFLINMFFMTENNEQVDVLQIEIKFVVILCSFKTLFTIFLLCSVWPLYDWIISRCFYVG